MNKKNLHLIGNAHIDPVWLWQWQEGFHEVKASFRSALDRMNEFDDFVFCASSAAFYEWIEQSDPDMFFEIQQRVAEGRWGIVGGWWIEPDCNIPSGESFVRHSLYGQRYFKEKFGVSAKTGFNIDSFGHAGTIPQILQQAGIDYYTFLRPGPHEMDLPSRVFTWQSQDGSQVTAFEIPYAYNVSGNAIEKYLKERSDEIPAELPAWMAFTGVGNHGGGPTIESINKIHEMNASKEFDYQLLYSTPEAFFEELEKSNIELPLVDTELQHHASGCYSVHSGIKQWNRQAENALIAAEKWATLTNAALDTTILDGFKHAWKQLLFNQFHDIMAGTSLEEAYEDARSQIGETIGIAERNLNLAIQAFAWNIKLPLQPEAFPIVVFNPLTWPVTETVELEIGVRGENLLLVDEKDHPIAHQMVRSHATTWRQRISFNAELPALGYRTYRLVKMDEEATLPLLQSPLKVSDTVLENDFIRLTIDPETGTVASLYNKSSHHEFISKGATPIVLNDPGDTWAHGVFEWHDAIGKFKAVQVELIENGPVKGTIRVVSNYNTSTVVQDFTLAANSEQVDVAVQVSWQEQLKMLKLQFPTKIENGQVTAENAYGHCVRQPNGVEEPMQRWVDLSNHSFGLSLLNDAKYSYDVKDNIISLTVLRSPVYAHHVPIELEENGIYHYIDQGWQRFNYSIVPHQGTWKKAGVVQKSEQLNQSAIAILATFHHDGELPQTDTFIHVDSSNILVTVLKEAEDGNGIIVRAVETLGKQASATIKLPLWNCTITDEFKPMEIKTYLIPNDERLPVRSVNVLEL